jgi:curli biogenesis system outer membrane secretion channel CsgG
MAVLRILSAPVILGLASSLFSPQAVASDAPVERCSKSFDTLAVAESQAVLAQLSPYGLGSPTALLRMMVQKSGCFDVVERGQGMEALKAERAMAQSGDLRQDANIGQGQMQAADFVLSPQVQIGTQTTGSLTSVLGGLTRSLGVIAGLGAGLKFKEASTSLLVSDVRSSLQVAAAEGKANKTEFDFGALGFLGGVVGGVAGFENTPEGKVVAASFLDNYNKIVISIRDQPTLLKNASAQAVANSANTVRAEAPQRPGEVLRAKIANVRVYEDASRDSRVLGTLQLTDDVVASGEVKNDFIRVDGASVSGWVQRTVVGLYVSGNAFTGGTMTTVTVAPATVTTVTGPLVVGNGARFTGTFGEAENGRVDLTVNKDGMLLGTGRSASLGDFILAGKLDESGSFLLASGGFMSTPGTAPAAMFVGRYEPGTGNLVGTWQYGGTRTGGGPFTAQRVR